MGRAGSAAAACGRNSSQHTTSQQHGRAAAATFTPQWLHGDSGSGCSSSPGSCNISGCYGDPLRRHLLLLPLLHSMQWRLTVLSSAPNPTWDCFYHPRYVMHRAKLFSCTTCLLQGAFCFASTMTRFQLDTIADVQLDVALRMLSVSIAVCKWL